MDETQRLICASQALADSGRGVRFEVEYFGERAPAFAVRYAGEVHAYLNRCAHVAMELDWQEGVFFDSDGRDLLCSTHGATYDARSGRCVGGPGRGRGGGEGGGGGGGGDGRRARLWGIFFKLLTFAYVTLILIMTVDWQARTDLAGGKKHTALVELNGVIAPGADASAERIMTGLQAAFKDKNTQGVILRINSPGGSPVQSQLIYDEMRRLRKKYPDTPLYVVVEDICASGGYFVASGADRIYVAKASVVGSIGVLMNGFGFTGLMDKLGVERRLITAGENKGMLDPFSPVDQKDVQHAKVLINDVHQQFISAVKEGRGKRLKESPDMFSGLIWTGEKSVDLGLADAIGSLESVARDVVKAEDIVDFTQKENVAERLAKRFGMGAASAVMEFVLRASSGTTIH